MFYTTEPLSVSALGYQKMVVEYRKFAFIGSGME